MIIETTETSPEKLNTNDTHQSKIEETPKKRKNETISKRKDKVFKRSEEDVEASLKEVKGQPTKIMPKKDKYLEIKFPLWRYKKYDDPLLFQKKWNEVKRSRGSIYKKEEDIDSFETESSFSCHKVSYKLTESLIK